jgi:ferric-dicitrate binding protein FerR (iron transport regulator)
MNKITEQQFYDLLSLKLSGDATAKELALLEEQLLLNPQWQFLYDQMMSPHTPLTDEEHTQQAFAAHIVRMQLQGKLGEVTEDKIDLNNESKKAVRRPLYRRLALAGLAAASIGGAIYFTAFHRSANSATAVSEIATRKGSKSNIKLPDGTEVWLNADSKLTYNENFIGSTREVTLTGEAFFDVVHDTAHPFIIHTGNASIRVLGTAFNVRNYPRESSIETTLMRGRIEVSFADRPNEKLILKPLEKLIVSKDTDSLSNAVPAECSQTSTTVHPADKVILTSVTYSATDSLIAETSWVDDKMVFVNQPLEKIAEELERHFAVTIVFKDPKVRKYRYTGVFNNESIEKVLQIIELSKPISYESDGKTIFIH